VVVDDDEPEGPVGFAALLQKRAKKIEGSSTLRKGLLVETKASEADQKWREVHSLLYINLECHNKVFRK
jgi:hypothetical protein